VSWWKREAPTDIYPLREDDKFPYHHNRLFERINFAKDNAEVKNKHIDLMLWHQGESDGVENTSGEAYKTDLKTFILQVRETLGWNIPIFISKTSYAWGTTYPQITSAQTEVINDMSRVYLGVETDKYGSAYRHDDIHFNLQGMNTIPNEWVTKIKEQSDVRNI
jgi:hypothetical protein